MKYLITSILNNEEKEQLQKQKLYCYDLRYSDFGEKIATIEKNVLVNRVGSIVTNKEISLGKKYSNNFVDYENFISNNEEVYTIQELLVKKEKIKKEIKIKFCKEWR